MSTKPAVEQTPLASPEHPFPKRRSANEEGEYSPAGYDADLNAPTITPEEMVQEKIRLEKLAAEREKSARE